MNKNYKNKKRITIMILSVLAFCLAACLVWHLGTMGKAELPMVEPETSERETAVTIPEIDASGIVEPRKETEPEQETEPEEVAEPSETGQAENGLGKEEEAVEESGGDGEESTMAPGTQPPRTDGKLQSPADAVPPPEPPAEGGNAAAVENPDEDGSCRPEHVQPQETQPQGGDTNPSGAVYVPGFGYIESSGPNEQGTSYTDGDWDRQIGSM